MVILIRQMHQLFVSNFKCEGIGKRCNLSSVARGPCYYLYLPYQLEYIAESEILFWMIAGLVSLLSPR